MNDPRKRRPYREADAPADAELDAAEYASEDADREMFGDEVADFGLDDIGCK